MCFVCLVEYDFLLSFIFVIITQVTLNDGRNLPAVVEDIDYAKDLAVIRVSCVSNLLA